MILYPLYACAAVSLAAIAFSALQKLRSRYDRSDRPVARGKAILAGSVFYLIAFNLLLNGQDLIHDPGSRVYGLSPSAMYILQYATWAMMTAFALGCALRPQRANRSLQGGSPTA